MLFEEYASNTSDEELKDNLLKLSKDHKVHKTNSNFLSKDPICNTAKLACKYSNSPNCVMYCINEFIKQNEGTDVNNEVWYYDIYDEQPYEMIEISIRGAGTLEIIKFLISSGFKTTWRPLTRAACQANKLDILKFLVESGVKVSWGLDKECSNDYNSTTNPQIKRYLKEIGKNMGVTSADFRLFDMP